MFANTRIRPLYDRVVVKRVAERRPPCKADCISPIPQKKSPKRAK